MLQTIHPKKQYAANCGDFPALVVDGELRRMEFPSVQPSHGRKALGSGSEVNRFRVQFRHRFFIKRAAAHSTLKLGYGCRISLAVRGTNAHIDPDREDK